MISVSASGVGSIAFAKTGFVLLCTVSSEMLRPGSYDLIEMLKEDLTRLASQTRVRSNRLSSLVATCWAIFRARAVFPMEVRAARITSSTGMQPTRHLVELAEALVIPLIA
jgi:hypothetical protein